MSKIRLKESLSFYSTSFQTSKPYVLSLKKTLFLKKKSNGGKGLEKRLQMLCKNETGITIPGKVLQNVLVSFVNGILNQSK